MTDRVIRIVFDTAQANRSADTFKGKLEQVQTESEETKSSLNAVSAAAVAAFAGAAIEAARRYGDAMTRLQNRLRLVTDSNRQLIEVQGRLFDIAQRTATPLNELGELYTRTAMAVRDLGVTQEETLTITEAVANAARISGSTQQESAGAIRQFTQALSGGVLRAEEFNSVIEGTPRLARALADAFGVTSGELRQLVIDGRITAENITDALLSQAEVLENEFATATLTTEDNMTKLQNAAQLAFGEFDAGAGITESISTALDDLAGFLSEDQLLFETLGEAAARLFLLMENGVTVVRLLITGFAALGKVAGAAAADGLDAAADAARTAQDELTTLIGTLNTLDEIENVIDENRRRRNGGFVGPPEPGASGSSGDFDAETFERFGVVTPTGTGRKGRGGGRGGGKTDAEKAASFVQQLEREAEAAGKTRAEVARLKLERLGAGEALIEQAQAHIQHVETLKAETAAAKSRADELQRNRDSDADFAASLQENLNLLQLTTEEQERYQAQLQLSKDATDAQREAVDDLVIALQEQRDANELAADELERSQQMAEDFSNAITSGLGRAITSGEGFKGVLKGIIQQLLQMILKYQTLNPLVDQFNSASGGGGGGGGGFFSSLLGGFFGGGGGGGGGALPIGPDVITGPFARGGSFTVPNTGGGGVDTERVMFDATAGERVTVEPLGTKEPTVNVEVINTTGQPADVEETRTLDGERQIRVLVGAAMNDLDSTGARDAANRSNFGTVRRGTIR